MTALDAVEFGIRACERDQCDGSVGNRMASCLLSFIIYHSLYL